VELPLDANGNYSDLKVYWGDGTSSSISGASDWARFHTYADSSERVITLTGSFDRLIFYQHEPERLLDVRFWGSNAFTSFADMFRGCSQLKSFSAPDPPDTALVNDFSGTFQDAIQFNGTIGNWNVSSATNLSRMFKGARSFDQNINEWQVGSVTHFSEMFSANEMEFGSPNATAGPLHPMIFNQPLDQWNTQNGANFSKMFAGAVLFNQALENWETSEATDLSGMFFHAHTFNQPVSSLKNAIQLLDLKGMFRSARAFNQDVSDLPSNSVTDFSEMFMDAVAFNNGGNALALDTSNAIFFDSMFSGARNFNADISSWMVPWVLSMNSMFKNAAIFNCNLSSWGLRQGVSREGYDTGAVAWDSLNRPNFL
jgi:hypothetical protein